MEVLWASPTSWLIFTHQSSSHTSHSPNKEPKLASVDSQQSIWHVLYSTFQMAVWLLHFGLTNFWTSFKIESCVWTSYGHSMNYGSPWPSRSRLAPLPGKGQACHAGMSYISYMTWQNHNLSSHTRRLPPSHHEHADEFQKLSRIGSG